MLIVIANVFRLMGLCAYVFHLEFMCLAIVTVR